MDSASCGAGVGRCARRIRELQPARHAARAATAMITAQQARIPPFTEGDVTFAPSRQEAVSGTERKRSPRVAGDAP